MTTRPPPRPLYLNILDPAAATLMAGTDMAGRCVPIAAIEEIQKNSKQFSRLNETTDLTWLMVKSVCLSVSQSLKSVIS